jgi:asparagine synthase (glutamine-hydrolysing)
MCGIVGISTAGSMAVDATYREGRRMLASIAHRGPDDSGLAMIDNGRGVVGNTRLAILDLSSAGHQPMRDESNGNVIVFNGEIYNHREVRKLIPHDERYPWKSASDTETILRAYGAFGEACVDHLRGMFSFCIWDESRGALFCVRDRIGIKPFYHYSNGQGMFAFASEVRALLGSTGVPRKIDESGLAGFIRFGSVPEPLTLIEGIRSLPAGHKMLVRSGRIEDISPFWQSRAVAWDRNRLPGSAGQETIQQLRDHLVRSVGEQLRSDVPVATFLSGGVDSSVITAVAARASSKPIHTITLGFEDREFDETEYATTISGQYKTIQHRVGLSFEQVVNLIPEAVRRCDLPSVDGVNTYLASRAAVQSGIKVVLSGLGGDELFGGYRTFRLLKWAGRVAPLVKWAAPIASFAFRGGGAYGRGLEMISASGLEARYSSLRSLWSMTEMREMGFHPQESDEMEKDGTLLSRVSRLELASYMRSTLLRDSDAMSMAQSIELRVPFLDHELVEWCLAIGAADYSRGSGRKRLLLQAAAGLLPAAIWQRPKQGFSLPMDKWMRGPLRSFVDRGLSAVRASGILPGVDVPRLQERFQRGGLAWARLWQFVVLGHWVEQHLGESQ